MKIILANPRGFCAGVYMAIDVVDQLLDVVEGDTIYVYHAIVHNKHVVQRFEDRGVIFIESIDDVPEGSIVVFSAHGVSPEVRKEAKARNLTAIDATSRQTKVHAEAIRYAKRGWQIVLIGHRQHQEIIGTYGEAPDSIQILESAEGIPDLNIDDPSKVVYLTQTTLSLDDANKIINALKEAYPEVNSPPSEDVCYATTNRQWAVRQLAHDCDLVLVVGSQNSSNSLRPRDRPRHRYQCRPDRRCHRTDGSPRGNRSGTLTAGAAPEDLVQSLVPHLVRNHEGEVEQTTSMKASTSTPGTLKKFSDRVTSIPMAGES